MNLTKDNILKTLLIFTLPYLLSSFLQTFYGMADLYIVGQFYDAAMISAVSIGSQFMHFVTVIIMGLAVGTTVRIGQAIGAKRYDDVSKIIINSILLFCILAFLLTSILTLNTGFITHIMSTPIEAVLFCKDYLLICLIGIPFIIAYNVICSIFRGLGDSKSPMYFVAISCLFNIILDYIFVGNLKLGASGAAYATVIAQGVSFILALIYMIKKDFGFKFHLSFKNIEIYTSKLILTAGLPISLQDGFIQVSFLIITVIANSLGLISSTSVGIVEKIISFLFLVPSAILSSLSALVALNVGAKESFRAKKLLDYGLMINISFGILCCLICQLVPETILSFFTSNTDVIISGAIYLRSYSIDCIFAGMHFAYSGYFCGYGYSYVSFIHNIISVIFFRIPIAYLSAKIFGTYLYCMGLAAPIGSFISAIICFIFFIYFKKKRYLSLE